MAPFLLVQWLIFLNLRSDASIKDVSQAIIIAVVRVYAGIAPLLAISQAPVDGISRIEDDPFKEDPLGPAITLPEGVRNIDRAVGLGYGRNKQVAGLPFKPTRIRNL